MSILLINPQNIAVYNICSVLFSGSKAAVILQEELLHKNVLQDVKKCTRPGLVLGFLQSCQSFCDQTHQL